jgi:colicin import membrane protein
MALHLPDFGEVKVQLELSENGNVQTVKVLRSASQKNREYLEKELPRMSFSCITGHKLSAKERTFVISFHNEM